MNAPSACTAGCSACGPYVLADAASFLPSANVPQIYLRSDIPDPVPTPEWKILDYQERMFFCHFPDYESNERTTLFATVVSNFEIRLIRRFPACSAMWNGTDVVRVEWNGCGSRMQLSFLSSCVPEACIDGIQC